MCQKQQLEILHIEEMLLYITKKTIEISQFCNLNWKIKQNLSAVTKKELSKL
jgi:hypothetical protein